jgi:hypothetical protein
MANSNNSFSLNSLLSSKKGNVKTNTAGYKMPTGNFVATITAITDDVHYANGEQHAYFRIHFKVQGESYNCTINRLYFRKGERDVVVQAIIDGKTIDCKMQYIEIERYGRNKWGYDCTLPKA